MRRGATKLNNILAVVDGYGKEYSGLVCLIFVGKIECFKRERENQNCVSSVEHIRTQVPLHCPYVPVCNSL